MAIFENVYMKFGELTRVDRPTGIGQSGSSGNLEETVGQDMSWVDPEASLSHQLKSYFSMGYPVLVLLGF